MAEIHGNKIITSGLVLHLDAANPQSFDGNSVTWRDLSGNNNHGTLVNGVGYSNSNGGSLVFDGIDDYMANTSNSPFVDGSMTYEIIFRANVNPLHGPLGSSDFTGTSPYFYLDYHDGYIWTYNAGATPQYFSVQSLPINTIHHFVTTRNGLVEKNYINGTQTVGRTLNNSSGNNNGFRWIGGAPSLSWYFKCNIYSVRIYNRPLSDSEILQNYYATRGRYDRVLYLDAGNPLSYTGSGTTWSDMSGYRNNGTLVNGVTYNSANGGAMVFDGSNDYVNLGDKSYFDVKTTNFTINAWIKYTSNTRNGIFSKGSESSWYQFKIFDSKLSFSMKDINGIGLGNLLGNTTLSPNIIYFVSVSVNRITGIASLYLNSVWDGDLNISSVTGSVSSTDTAKIGASRGGGELFNGYIYQVSFYNREQHRNEISDIYNTTKSRYGL